MSAGPKIDQPKLMPPRRRRDTIRRARLHQMLGDAFEHDALVVSAPAGYGKSTLAVDWLDELGLPVAWLSLDDQDRDPLTLVSNLVAAVRVPFPAELEQLAERLRAGAAATGARALVTEFSAAVQGEIDDLFMLVIDDLHALDDAQEALESLDALIRGVPLSMRLCVLSRSWPSLPSLTRMLAQRKALSLTANDLQFTEEEAVEFLRRSGVTDSASQSALIQRADGWAAALAILVDHYDTSRTDRGTDVSSEFILSDFVEQEVLTRLPRPSVELLETCAVFRSFNAELMRELVSDPEAPALLRELERTNHLIVRLQDGDWLRMHALLRERLLDRLAREEPDRLRRLRRSAAAVCARSDMRREAMQRSLDAGDWPEAVLELHELREDLYQGGEWATLAGWLDQLPADVIEDDPDLLMTRARLLIKQFDGQGGLAQLDRLDDRALTVEQRARWHLYRSVAFRQINRLPDAIEACRRARAIAREELPDESSLFAEIDLEEGVALALRGNFASAHQTFEAAVGAFERLGDHHRAAEAHDCLAGALFHQGWLAESMQELTAAARQWRALAEPHAEITTTNKVGNVQHMLGELETARDTFNVLVQRARDIGDRRMEAYGHEGLATVERDMGHLEAAKSLYGLAMQETQEFDDPVLVADVTFGLAMTYREGGDFRRASTLLEHGLRSAEQAGTLLHQTRFRTGIGAALLSEHRFQEAIPVLERASGEANEAGAKREEALARLLLASACYHRRRRTLATEELRRVHALVEELGYDQFLHAEARQMLDVAEYAAAKRIGGEYFRRLCEQLRASPETPAPEVRVGDSGVPRIRAEAFGNPRVTLSGRQIKDLEWRSERSKEMFFLLLHTRRPLRKDQIAVELWPELSPKQLNSAFHSTLYRLRRAIDPQVVEQADGGYRVTISFDISYDALEFEDHNIRAEQAPAGSEEWTDHLAAAVSLYRGPFAEPFDSVWAEEARRRYEDQYLACLLALAAHALRGRDYSQVISLSESATEVDHLNEQAVQYLMQAHSRSGRLDLATRVYRRLQRAMREELDEEPSVPVQAVYRHVISGAALDS